ncbi:2',3'-cyclic-nucleotide 2'-phosphodiesterase (5'-nucleotidase family) [Jatrophihabitans sp. GAS493]|nr:2',3'-cyclic-nucleotide 2'-phosphodiesterase (5'-nucleotidase family) [Jatrophihabitans sp. GAS493]
MRPQVLKKSFALLSMTTAVAAGLVALSGQDARASAMPTQNGDAASDSSVLLFDAAGLQSRTLESLEKRGALPAYARLQREGVSAESGITTAVPAATGPDVDALTTGAWPARTGTTGDTYFDTRSAFSSSLSSTATAVTAGPAAGADEAESLAASAEGAGRLVAQLDWPGGLAAGIAGPTVDRATSYSQAGVVQTPAEPTRETEVRAAGFGYQAATIEAATGWSHVPSSRRPALQSTFSIETTSSAVNPNRDFDLFIYATSRRGYDRVLIVPASAGKDGVNAVATLSPGNFAPIRLSGDNSLTGIAAGAAAGFYVKLTTLSPDVSHFGLYYTPISRANAQCFTAACNALPTSSQWGGRFANYLAENLPPAVYGDAAALQAGVIDERTWYEQTSLLSGAYERAVDSYVLGKLQPHTNVVLAGTDVISQTNGELLALLTPTTAGDVANPFFDRFAGSGRRDHLTRQRQSMLEGAYRNADHEISTLQGLLGTNTDVVATSDHAVAPAWRAVDPALPLVHLGLQDTEQSANCQPAAVGSSLAKACSTGATTQIYLELAGRDPDGTVAATDYSATVSKIVNAYRDLVDPTTGQRIVQAVYTKSDLANLPGTGGANPTRSGDVTVILRPPYTFTGATAGTQISTIRPVAEDGYLPGPDKAGGKQAAAPVFLAAGPGIDHHGRAASVQQVDVAPTLAVLGGFDPPLQTQGHVLTSILQDGDRYVQAQLLAVNDLHGNITGNGLTYSDPYTGVKDAAGGIAALAGDLERARSENPNTVTVEAGDMVGGSPPETALLRDKPTLDAMNLMGFDIGTLGNHEFDRGVKELQLQINGGTSTVDPSIDFNKLDYPVVDANVISDATGQPLLPPYLVKRVAGVPIGFIGATTIFTPTVTTTDATAGVHFTDEVTAINGSVAALEKQGVHTFVVIIHEGGTQTSFPVGVVSDRINSIAAHLDPAVKLVVSGHTHTTVSTRVGQALVVQASSYGRAFDQVQLLLDRKTETIKATWGAIVPVWRSSIPQSTDPDAPAVPIDQQVQAIVDNAVATTNPITQRLINTASTDIPSQRENGQSAAGESPAGDLIADAQRAYAGTQLAFVNTGSIRSGFTAGPVTFGSLYTAQPFQDNYVDTFELTGAQVWAVLAQQLATGTGGIMQVSGLHFAYTGTQGSGSITGVWLGKAGDDSNPIPNDGSQTYTATANSFAANGGDGFTVLKGASNVVQQVQPVLTALVDFVSKQPDPFTYSIDGRIVKN